MLPTFSDTICIDVQQRAPAGTAAILQPGKDREGLASTPVQSLRYHAYAPLISEPYILPAISVYKEENAPTSGARMGLFVDDAGQSSSIRPSKASDTSLQGKGPESAASTSSLKSITPTILKKPTRDSTRKETHSQIERRRREKINDRLVTLRSLVPACAAEIEDRKRQKREEEEEARQIAAGEKVASSVRGGKRKRVRRRSKIVEDGGDKDDELGLHKLEVLTHAIDYIYELQDCIAGLRGDRLQARDIEEEEEGSEADLELSEWRPSVKRRSPDFNSHPSNVSSGHSSSIHASPAIMSLSAESPMFSTTASSSNSVFTNLTSPMMSLSSESPILRWNKQTSSSPTSNREKEAQRTASWQLPAPALPMEDTDKKARKVDVCESNDAAQEAQLLLNIGSSPEVLRPISALRQTSQSGVSFKRRKSTALPADGGFKSSQLARIGGSAPGGAQPSNSTALVSPPLLHLDAPLYH